MEKLTKKQTEKALDVMVKSGDCLAACPLCKEYLSYSEYALCVCLKCNKIDFNDIVYFPGATKANN